MIVDVANYGLWLEEETDPERLRALFYSVADERLELAEVSPAVNKPGNDVIECITPIRSRQ